MKKEKVCILFLTTLGVASGCVFHQIISRLHRMRESSHASSAVDFLGPRQRYRGQAPEAQNLNEISKSFVLNLVSPLFVAFGKQHFVDLKIALPIKIVDCISNIAYWFNFDTCYNG